MRSFMLIRANTVLSENPCGLDPGRRDFQTTVIHWNMMGIIRDPPR